MAEIILDEAPPPLANGTSPTTAVQNGDADRSETMIQPTPADMLSIPAINPSPNSTTISADDIALYDRQIRLWGVEAQKKIQSANVLLVGMKALGNEIAKNLVLAGIGALTIMDHGLVTEEDLSAQFLVTAANINQNRAQAALPQLQKLNPKVALFQDSDVVALKMPEYFSSFDITIVTGLPLEVMNMVNSACRIFGRKFYAADIHGMYGYAFADLISHNFVVEKQRTNVATKPNDIESPTRRVVSVRSHRENGKVTELVTKQETYSPLLLANTSPLPFTISNNRRARSRVTPLLSALRALFDFQTLMGGRLPDHSHNDLQTFTRLANEKHRELQLPMETLAAEFLRPFLQNLGSELTVTAAYLGGALAQDVINVLGEREQPLQNLLLFDGEQMEGPVYSMHPIFEEKFLSNGSTDISNGFIDLASDGVVTA